MQEGLYDATHANYGTAAGIFGSFPVPIAGKTGTAEKYVTLPGYQRPSGPGLVVRIRAVRQSDSHRRAR